MSGDIHLSSLHARLLKLHARASADNTECFANQGIAEHFFSI
jgi:hypothetical protein